MIGYNNQGVKSLPYKWCNLPIPFYDKRNNMHYTNPDVNLAWPA